MTKNELVKDMRAYTGAGFITRQKLASYMGKKDPHKIDRYLANLPKIGRDYFIPDVAEQIMRIGFG